MCEQLLLDEYCMEQDMEFEQDTIDFYAFIKQYQQYVALSTQDDFDNYVRGTNDQAFYAIEARLKMKSSL